MAATTQSVSKVLDGKVALVTGGGRGIGAAISRRLAADGAKVLVNYARSADAAKALVQEIRAAGGNADLLQGDVGDPKQIASLFATLDKSHGGRLDILVNNAGIYKTGSLVEISQADYDASYAINVHGVFNVTRHAITRMGDGGRIITIGSVVGERALAPGMSVYAATKFAVAGMTRAWAHEFAERGITANVVQPGPIDTDMNPADVAVNPGAAYMAQMVPMKRYGKAEEVAAAVAFIASPGSAFVNGSTLNVDGGVNA